MTPSRREKLGASGSMVGFAAETGTSDFRGMLRVLDWQTAWLTYPNGQYLGTKSAWHSHACGCFVFGMLHTGTTGPTVLRKTVALAVEQWSGCIVLGKTRTTVLM